MKRIKWKIVQISNPVNSGLYMIKEEFMNEGRTEEITQKNNGSRNGGYAGDIMKHEE